MNAVIAMRQLLLVMNTTHTDATGHRRRYLRGPPGAALDRKRAWQGGLMETELSLVVSVLI